MSPTWFSCSLYVTFGSKFIVQRQFGALVIFLCMKFCWLVSISGGALSFVRCNNITFWLTPWIRNTETILKKHLNIFNICSKMRTLIIIVLAGTEMCIYTVHRKNDVTFVVLIHCLLNCSHIQTIGDFTDVTFQTFPLNQDWDKTC